jgi:hypothetical protein
VAEWIYVCQLEEERPAEAQAPEPPLAAFVASQVGAALRTQEQLAPRAVETAEEGLGKVVAEVPSAWGPPGLARAAWQEPEEARRMALGSPARDARRLVAVLAEADLKETLAELRQHPHWAARTCA